MSTADYKAAAQRLNQLCHEMRYFRDKRYKEICDMGDWTKNTFEWAAWNGSIYKKVLLRGLGEQFIAVALIGFPH